jgi:hypothetical protein
MAKKVAFASSDGRLVDLHFGHTEVFFIYELFEDTTNFLETRKV